MGRKHKNFEELLTQGKDLIEFYRAHPCTAAYELLGVDLAPIQRLIFRDMWFKNYVIAVCGRGAGKSQSIDSIANFNNKGLVYLYEELPPIPTYLKDREEEIISLNVSILTSEGFRDTKRLCLEKNILGKKLLTKNGFINKGSNHHPILTLDEQCNFVYKSLDSLSPGDRVCIQRGQQCFGNNVISKDDSYLLGLFIGDGSIGKGNNPSITTADENIRSFCIDYCNKNKVDFREAKNKRTDNTCSVFFKNFSYFFNSYKVSRVLSYYKSVPYTIRTSDRETQISFLQGYFDSDGTASSRGSVSCCSVSKKLLKEIQLMLLNFGIVSRVRKKKTKSKFGKAYLLDMYSADAYKFKECIGFRLERKQSIIDNYFKDLAYFNTNKDTIPSALNLCYDITSYYHNTYRTTKKPNFIIKKGNKKELTYTELNKFLIQCKHVENLGFSLSAVSQDIDKLKSILDSNYYFDTVADIKDWVGDCYDFEMDMLSDSEPNYFSNGFINHNTFLDGTLAALSCLLYPGYRVGLIAPVFRQSLVIKSNSYDTFWTTGGMITNTEDMYENIVPNITQIQSLDNQNTILSKWKNDDRSCRYIKTTKGFEMAGTADHSIIVLNNHYDLDLEFKDLQDLKYSDHIAIKTGFNYFGNNNSMPKFNEFKHDWRTKDCLTPKELAPDLAYWMGLLVGDGCISVSKDKRKQRVDFVNEDQDLLDSFENYLREYFLIDKNEKISRDNRKNNTWKIEYYCKKLVEYLLKCGFTKTTALDKKIPDVIKKASREVFIAFLQGLFDTDGGVYVQYHKDNYTHCEIAFNTSSKQLAKEVQATLLNLGIVSNLTINSKATIRKLKPGNRPSKCAESYKIRITGQRFLLRFKEIINFRCLRKYIMLNDYISSHFKKEEGLARSLGLPYEVVKLNYNKCESYFNRGLYFVKLKKDDYFFAPTVDIEVENESCYWANGFINHNSKLIFAEVEKLYEQSSILREATVKAPIRGSDVCYLKFKSVAGKPGSYIEALPLGTDGSKIRGSRFYLIIVDELAQVPDQTLDMVVRPMGATSLAPMERVRRLEEKKRLIATGLATEEDFQEEKVNKMVMTSSGYYKFNHMWRRMKDHWRMIDEAERKNEKSPYAVWQVPYWDLPEGFSDANNIAEAQRIMSSHEFSMEYEAAMISDSEGFFKASMIEQCTLDSGHSVEIHGEKSAQYILGIDPNQGGKASAGVTIIRVGQVNRVVNVMELKNKTIPELTNTIQEVCDRFNIIRIFMDKGGGGKAISDLLVEGYGGYEPIVDRTNDEYRHLPGRHTLELVNFNPGWIADANFTTRAMLEDKQLLFPETPINSVLDLEAKIYEDVKTLKSQMLNIVVTQTATGVLHFDTPSKGQNKDLYSSIILAAHGARMVAKELEDNGEPILHNDGGLIRFRNGSATFNSIHQLQSSPKAYSPISAAILKKKVK